MLTKFIVHSNKTQIQCIFFWSLSFGDIIKQISKTPLKFICASLFWVSFSQLLLKIKAPNFYLYKVKRLEDFFSLFSPPFIIYS